MASGQPDYLRVVRPVYGGARLESNVKEAVLSDVTYIVSVTGKGIIYGGVLWLNYTSTQNNSIVQLIVDDVQLNDLTFYRMSIFHVDRARTMPLSLNFYDNTDFVYSVGLAYGITFERSLVVGYQEEHGTTPLIHARLCYATF